MPDASCYRILVAIETDATQYHGAGARRPRLLGAAATDQLLAHLAADFETLLPGSGACWLAAPGALLDQTQLLRPGYPPFRALEKAALSTSSRVGIPERGGRLEPAELNPEPGIPLGVLQLLPVVVCGPREAIAKLGAEMEHRFLEKGQVSAHTARWLESAFGVSVRHARFMTLTDLNAMFRLQLEHFGFLPLWELIDAALTGRREPLEVRTADGQKYTWQRGAVQMEYQTFDYWAVQGLGRSVESERGKLAGAYAEWTRQVRQFLTTLSAHGIPAEFHLATEPVNKLAGTYFVEEGAHAPPPHSAAVTEHSFSELGTVCVTTVCDGRQQNHYPIAASGLNDIHRAIRERSLDNAAIAYPGSILYDPSSRSLVPERDDPSYHRGRS